MNLITSIGNVASRVQSAFQEFFRSSSAGGVVILTFTVLAMLWTNSQWNESYESLVHVLHHIVNDGLMVLFFLHVGLEIKREMLVGELSSVRKATLPLLAALFGMIGPGFIYLLINAGTPVARGWGIPVATDIAFALGILSLLGKRVPLSLKVFLAALAIADDLLAVLVIALFYTASLDATMLLGAVAVTGALLVCNRKGVRSLWTYLALGVCLWYCVLNSGIHATIAGVVLAFTIPADFKSNNTSLSPLHRLEHALNSVIAFGILPLFALVNAGVRIQPSAIEGLTGGLSLGIILGLFFGKQIWITTSVWLAVKLKLAVLPDKIRIQHIYATSILCGIGFTMSIFVAQLAFTNSTDLEQSKLSIMVASVLAAVIGLSVLAIVLRKHPVDAQV